MGKFIYRFFWWFAGANIKVLEENSIDHNKYFQIGMSVFTTAIMATFTSLIAFHYAINRGFEGDISPFAIGASIFWGFLILNLDRFLVLSMVKQGNTLLSPTALEKFQNFLTEFAFAIPRIILAVLIASVIVEPFELYLFSDQIKAEQQRVEEIQRLKYKEQKEISEKKIKENYEKDIKRVNDRYAQLIQHIKNRIAQKEKEINHAKDSKDVALTLLKQRLAEESASYHLYEEQAKLEGSSARGGCGPECRKAQSAQRESFSILMKIKDEIKARKVFLDENIIETSNKVMKQKEKIKQFSQDILNNESSQSKELASISVKLQKNLLTIQKEEKQNQKSYNNEGIMNALYAKESVFTEKKYNQIHQLLWLLLLVIELLPIILKLLFKRTSYDAHIQRLSDEASFEHDTFLRDEKLKRQMAFKTLYLKENRAYKKLNNENI